MAILGKILLMPKGDYDPAEPYRILDWVRYDNKLWVCTADCTGETPATTSAYWQFMTKDGMGIADITATPVATGHQVTITYDDPSKAPVTFVVTNGAGGDMYKAFYDPDGDGSVNEADKARALYDPTSGKTADTDVLTELGEDSSGNLVYKGKPIIGGASGGSILHVHTKDFIGMTVTVTDSDPDTGEIETLTSTFDSTGLATFHVTGSGIAEVSVTDTDGKVYKSSVNMTYYGIYTVSVNRFSATINVTVENGAVVTATDGTNTYSATSNGTAVINIGNAGTFTVSATMNGVTSDDKKVVVIATDGETKSASIAFASITMTFVGTLVANVSNGTFNAPVNDGSGTYKQYVPSIGAYTIIGTLDGVDISASADVTGYANVDVDITAGNNYYEDWLTAGGFTTATYPTLADLFTEDSAGANEKAVRKLMTVHASSDILEEWITEEPTAFDDFLSSRIAMKWIGLRDYVFDKLMAIEGIATKLINNETEFTLSDGTVKKAWEYILKDKVPVMTSANAPYGTVNRSSAYQNSQEGWTAFANLASPNVWTQANSDAGKDGWVSYEFTNPINIRVGAFRSVNHTGYIGLEFKVQYLDESDNTWKDACDYQTVNDVTDWIYVPLQDKGYHKSWRMYLKGYKFLVGGWCQFYGRSLNVSVPAMKGNNDPFGEVFSNSVMQISGYDFSAFQAFTGITVTNTSSTVNRWTAGQNKKDATIGYSFKKPVKVSNIKFTVLTSTQGSCLKNYILEASNDNFVSEVKELYTGSVNNNTTGDGIFVNIDINPDKEYKSYRIKCVDTWQSQGYIALSGIQFYGVDYSEREFEDGSTMKYLYDHGVELETVNKVDVSSVITKNADSIDIKINSVSASAYSRIYSECDLANIDLIRVRVGNKYSLGSNGFIIVNSTDPATGGESFVAISDIPNNSVLAINKKYTGNKFVAIRFQAVGDAEITEMWLE